MSSAATALSTENPLGFDEVFEEAASSPQPLTSRAHTASVWRPKVGARRHELSTVPLAPPAARAGAPAAREAARALLRAVPQTEWQPLYAEHAALAGLQFERELTRGERARLAAVRWQLERVEDAYLGPRLDRLEYLARLHRDIAEDVASFAREATGRSDAWTHGGRRSR